MSETSDNEYDYAALRLGFWWQGSRPVGILFVHELGSTPEGVGVLAEALHQQGFWTAAPVLPGHEGLLDPAGLGDLDTDAHVACLRKWQDALTPQVSTVVIVGCGLGGSLALAAAQQYGADGVITVSTPAQSFARRRLRVSAARLFVGDVAGIGPDVKNAAASEASFERIPLAAFDRLIEIERAGLAAARGIDVPVLAMHAREDHIVASRDATELFESLSTRDKELAWLEHSYHRAWIDHDRDLLADRIGGFAAALESRAGRPAASTEPGGEHAVTWEILSRYGHGDPLDSNSGTAR